MPTDNTELLTEVDAAGDWFRARKTSSPWARLTLHDEVVATLEGTESVPAGNYVCRGEAGDFWPQTAERLTSRYILADDADEYGWRKCTPRPEVPGVRAAQIGHPFQVHARWGLLTGKAGDFLVQDAGDPSNLWIVDQTLFNATYERE